VDSPKSRFKKEEVENAIADGQPPAEIEELIRSWRGVGSRGRWGDRGKGVKGITLNS
jgi:hypothetical protein